MFKSKERHLISELYLPVVADRVPASRKSLLSFPIHYIKRFGI